MSNEIPKVRKTYDTAIPPTAGAWHKHSQARPNRIGITIQNQTIGPDGLAQLANFWVADSAKSRLTDAQWYAPGTGTIEDSDADQGEIWIYSDVANSGLTVIEKFRGD